MRKKDPRSAVNEVEEWRDAELAKKNLKTEKRREDSSKDGTVEEKEKEEKSVDDEKVSSEISFSSSTLPNHLKSGKGETDEVGRRDRPDNDDNDGKTDGAGVDSDQARTETNIPAAASSGCSALFGNIEGVGEGSDDDVNGSERDGSGSGADDDDSNSLAGSETSQCTGEDEDGDDGYYDYDGYDE